MTRSKTRRRLVRIFLALALLTMVSMAAVNIETAVRGVAQAEAQRAVDAGALAGAAWLISHPKDVTGAQNLAAEYTNANHVLGRSPGLRAATIAVNVDSGSVRVEVEATVYGVPRAVAWLVGVERATVTAVATAEARGCPTPSPQLGHRPARCIPKLLKLID